MVGVAAQAARDEGPRSWKETVPQRRERGKALSIVKSVGRLPLDKIIIYAAGERRREKEGRSGHEPASREGVNREPVHSLW